MSFCTSVCAVEKEVESNPSPKVLIATGWDSPDAEVFASSVSDFERGPFDGTVIRPSRELGDGKRLGAFFAFSKEHWEFSDFANMLGELAKAQPRSCTENFLLLCANPGDVDWFDDAGWGEIVGHWRLLARVARIGKLKGIAYDPEAYTPPWEPFNYAKQSRYGFHSFEESTAKARERGRAVMRAVASEYPNITILAYFLVSNLPRPASNSSFSSSLKDHSYGLAPGFIDGLLDEIPRSASLVDGNEYSYLYNSQSAYSEATRILHNVTSTFVSFSNRRKIATNWQVGHALYLDAYCNPSSSKWYIDPLGVTPTERLAKNAAFALQASDHFVWVYGETGRWWPSKMPYPTWPEKLPGVVEALQHAKE